MTQIIITGTSKGKLKSFFLKVVTYQKFGNGSLRTFRQTMEK